MNKPIHIGIAEDHLVVRQGLISLLKDEENLNIIFDVSNGKELLDQLKTSRPDIVLLDIDMPVMGGKEALEKIKIKYPRIKVIILSMFFEESYVIQFVTRGANGYIAKNTDIEKIIDAIYGVYEHEYYFDNKVSIIMANRLAHNKKNPFEVFDAGLTDREIEILKMACMEKSNKEIAEELSISIRTVEGHRSKLMEKTKSKNAFGLVSYAFKNKIIAL